MLHPVQNDNSGGARERKRRETRRRIMDEAVALVERKGFDNVTVEDICEAADISRRTFFNYMETKDEAVLGRFPFTYSPEVLERIRTTQTDNVLGLLVDSIAASGDDADAPCTQKRFALLEANPSLMHAEAARKRDFLTDLGRAVVDHLERFPEDRRLDGPVETEALIIIGILRTAIAQSLWSPPADGPPTEKLRTNARLITDYAKELAWQTT